MDLAGGVAITQTEWTPPSYLGVGVEDALAQRCSIAELLDLRSLLLLDTHRLVAIE
jgi:hypothetical protein